ncbi:DNA-directed RNA polymerase subunit omega [candidate division KSB1 bacterium]|nr:DNA-directed RNA polymerase subunit omega [candidate division KSB1 bacterium]
MDKKIFSKEDFEDLSENIYEAVMVVAQRARRIGKDQKDQIEQFLGEMETDGEENTGTVLDEKLKNEILKMKKPTVLAIEEMLEGELKYSYKGQS